MKLAKKMFASVIALAMVAALALTAFAATPTVTMSDVTANVGETVTITVSGKDIVGLESADLRFNFDAEAVEFVSAKGADGAEYALSVGGNPEAGLATFSFAFMEEAAADTDMVVISFKILKAATSELKLWYYSWDGTDMPAEVTAKITGTEVTTAAPETTTVEETTVAETTTVEETSEPETTTKAPEVPKTGEVGVAAVAGVMAIAAVAFVATRKKDEE